MTEKKFTIKLLGCGPMSSSGNFWSIKRTEMVVTSVANDVSAPFASLLMERNALKAARVVLSHGLIRGILTWCGQAQVRPTIVVPDTVFVVNKAVRPFAGHIQPDYAAHRVPAFSVSNDSVTVFVNACNWSGICGAAFKAAKQLAGFWIISKQLPCTIKG